MHDWEDWQDKCRFLTGCGGVVNLRILAGLQIELEAEEHTEWSWLALIRLLLQVREAVNEIDSEKLKYVFYSVSHFNVGTTVR